MKNEEQPFHVIPFIWFRLQSYEIILNSSFLVPIFFVNLQSANNQTTKQLNE